MKSKSIIIGLILILSLFIFTSNVFSDWTVTPTSINFGDVPIGTSKTVALTITNTNAPGGANISEIIFYPSISQVTATLVGSLPITPGNSVVVAVTFTPTTRGNYSGELVIITNDITKPSGSVSFTGSSLYTSALSVSPLLIDFGDVPVGSSKYTYLTITNNGSSNAQNIRISSSHSEITLDTTAITTLIPSESKTIRVTFTPTARGNYIGEILIIHDSPTTPAITVPFIGTSSYGTGIDVSPLLIDFGSVPIGLSKNEVLRIRNNGNSDLNVTITVIAGMPFTVSRSSFTLRPGQIETLMVTFQPTEKGVYIGTLTIVSDDINTPKVEVSLRGDTGAEFGLTFFPTIMNFGYVKINTIYDKFLRIYNTSSNIINLNLSIQNINGNAFSLPSSVPTSFSMVPGETRQIPIRFYPTDKISYSGLLVASTNTGTARISLIGTGSETGTVGLEPQNPPPSSKGSGGGCSIIGKEEKSTFGNILLMFAPIIAIALRKLYRKII